MLTMLTGELKPPCATHRLTLTANGVQYASLLANVAQLVEQLTRNEQVIGSNPIVGSSLCPQGLSVKRLEIAKLKILPFQGRSSFHSFPSTSWYSSQLLKSPLICGTSVR